MRGALLMGVAQAFAVLPGISRSGSTITAGLMGGVKPATAAEFSFLMFLPAIGGGTLLKARNLMDVAQSSSGIAYGCGFMAAFLSGLLAVSLVLSAIKRGNLQIGFKTFNLAAKSISFYCEVHQPQQRLLSTRILG